MLHGNIQYLKEIGNEIIYNDPKTGEIVSGLVGKIDYDDPNTAFVYIISPYDDENDKIEGVFKYKDIMVFDNLPEQNNGWFLDGLAAYKKRRS